MGGFLVLRDGLWYINAKGTRDYRPRSDISVAKVVLFFFSVCGCVSMWWLKPFEILSSDFYGSKMWSKARTCSKMAVFRCTVMRGYDLQGDHLSGNVREFDSSCQGSVRAFTMSQENFREKILSGKSCLKLFIVGLSCILASIQVFSRSLCCVKYYIYGWIMHRFIPTPTTDSDTSTGMIWVLSATNRQGSSHCLESGQPGCNVSTVLVVIM